MNPITPEQELFRVRNLCAELLSMHTDLPDPFGTLHGEYADDLASVLRKTATLLNNVGIAADPPIVNLLDVSAGRGASVRRRMLTERRIVLAIVDDAIARDFALEVDNGEDVTTTRGVVVCTPGRSLESDHVKTNATKAQIIDELFACDEARLYFHKQGDDAQQTTCVGWCYFVYGNDGFDVLSDYSTTLEDIGVLTRAQQLADELEQSDA